MRAIDFPGCDCRLFSMPTLPEIQREALKLPEAEWEELATRLLGSLRGGPSAIDLEWAELAEERFAALTSGRTQGLNRQEFFAEANRLRRCH